MCVRAEKCGICHNLARSYNCSCAKGYKGDGFKKGVKMFIHTFKSYCLCRSCRIHLFICGCLISNVCLGLVEAKYFQQLHQCMASKVGRETLRMFSATELAKASNNYSNEMILESGGFGTVFKGILLDGTSVAIKKSKKAFSEQDGHNFLKEVTILSQINHRNIVKLLGCGIQTKFPLLVSEFVPNGTLFEHLQSEGRVFTLGVTSADYNRDCRGFGISTFWSISTHFYRDVKSSNILLNEIFSPKVADFSRLISTSNDTHLTTNIMGTRGYLDPKYFQTYQLTDKSDVYSFGVVLLELIIGLEPLSAERSSEDWSLSNLFLSRVNNNRLREILDSKVVEEHNQQQMEDIGMLARECLYLERTRRPSMKEVVEELFMGKRQCKKEKSP